MLDSLLCSFTFISFLTNCFYGVLYFIISHRIRKRSYNRKIWDGGGNLISFYRDFLKNMTLFHFMVLVFFFFFRFPTFRRSKHNNKIFAVSVFILIGYYAIRVRQITLTAITIAPKLDSVSNCLSLTINSILCFNMSNTYI